MKLNTKYWKEMIWSRKKILYVILEGKRKARATHNEISCKFFLDILYQSEDMPFITSLLWDFIRNGHWVFSKNFSVSIDMIRWFIFFCLLMWWIALIDFERESALEFGDKSHLVVEYNSFYILLNSTSFPIFCWGFLHLIH